MGAKYPKRRVGGLMKRSLSALLTIFSCLCLMVATERRAYAYIDPGSGLMVLQTITTVLAGVGFFLRTHIKALFNRSKKAKPTLKD
jgi:hypothetical protein